VVHPANRIVGAPKKKKKTDCRMNNLFLWFNF
jgi:hypothetical protein